MDDNNKVVIQPHATFDKITFPRMKLQIPWSSSP